MGKILLTADWHIKLGQKNVPKEWQKARYTQLYDKINELDYDIHIIAGDVFDNAKPSLEEVSLFVEYLLSTKRDTLIIGGNHEMVSKRVSSLDNLEPLATALNSLLATVPQQFNIGDFSLDVLPYKYLKEYEKKVWPKKSDILITHVRGAIEPYVMPEIDLTTFDQYKIVLAGDLHHYHQQRNILYPGSPLTTSFVRSTDIKKGGIMFDTKTFKHEFIDFELPQLRRTTVSNPDDMIQTEYDHTIYELEADAATLKTVKDNELLDKKIAETEKVDSVLELDGLEMSEELYEYLSKVISLKEEEIHSIQETYSEVIDDTN